MRIRNTLAALAWAAATAAATAAPAPSEPFDVETLAPGVHVYRNRAAGFPGANSLVVERADGLLVVDAQPSPEAARALLGALAKTLKKPVRYLVLSHGHVESWGGASAFPKDTLVAGSSEARARLEDAGADAGAECRARAGDPAAWLEPERVLPVLHASGPFTLDDPVHKVVIYPLPHAHSRGDVWVDVVGTGVMAVGGVVVDDRNPYAADADVRGWISALNDLVRSDLKAVVPCAGRVLGVSDVRKLRDSLAWARGRVQQAFTDLVPQEAVVQTVLSDPSLPKWFDTQAKPSFVRLLVERALAETVADRRRRGMP